MVKKIVKMDLTKVPHVQNVNVAQEHSSVKITTAPHRQQFVMEQTIVEMVPMNVIAIYHVLNLNSNVDRMDAVF